MKGLKTVAAKAPARIDLAGGTVDIWPLYLFHENAMTINVAIDTFAAVRISRRSDGRVVITSRDRGLTFATGLDFRSLEGSPLEFIARIVKYYEPDSGLSVTTDCSAPAGAGLGGSSTLAVALSSALNLLLGRRFSRRFQLDVIRNIETRILGVPTGCQDYYPALYGGLNALSYGYAGTSRQRLGHDLKKLGSRLVLCYTGKERQSGVSNWDMVKRYLDGNMTVRKAMTGICVAAERMKRAFEENDLEAAACALNDEWENRKMLSPKVTNDKIEGLMKAARASGALAGKVCGAGGGGCIVFFVKAGMKENVGQALSKAGGQILHFKTCSHGVSFDRLQ